MYISFGLFIIYFIMLCYFVVVCDGILVACWGGVGGVVGGVGGGGDLLEFGEVNVVLILTVYRPKNNTASN